MDDVSVQLETVLGLCDNLPDSVVFQCVQERGGTPVFSYISGGIERLAGVSASDVLRDPGNLRRLILPDFLPTFLEIERQSAQRLADIDIEVPIRRPDRHVVWLRLRARPRRTSDGRVVWDGLKTDVTAQRKAGSGPQRPSRRRNASNIGRLGWWHYDPATRNASWDSESRAIFGFTEDVDLDDELLQKVIHADDLPFLCAKIQAALNPEGPRAFAIEYRVIRPDGRVRWINTRGIVNFSGEGGGRRALSLSGTVEDVTNRRSAEAMLRQHQERLRIAKSAAQLGIFDLDPRTGRIQWDERVTELWGMQPGEPPTVEMFVKCLHPDDRPVAQKAMEKALDPGGDGSYAATFRVQGRSDSRERWIEASGQAFFDNGHAVQLVGMVLDITERKQTQEELVRSHGLRLVGQLAGSIAHDFGNLLTVVSGNLQLAEMELADGAALGYVRQAIDAVERGASFNRRLSSLVKGRVSRSANLNVNQLVQQTAGLLRRVLGPMIDIRLDLDPAGCATRGDAAEIESALLNLVLNARDAMPLGGELAITTRQVASKLGLTLSGEAPQPAGYMLMSVSDSGVGMSDEVMRRAPEPFFTTKAHDKGAGLGLTSVARTVKAVGGLMSIESTPGKGTCVSLYFPQASGDEAGVKTEHEERVPYGAGELILVVEDDVEVRIVVERRIAALGYQVCSAADGLEAIAMLKKKPTIQLVFSDVVMPGGMSGFELARWIRSHHPEIGVLLTSGYPSEVERGDASCDTVLTKPYSLSQLAEAIRDALVPTSAATA